MDRMHEETFTDAEIATVIEQGIVYTCACPAQVALALRHVRDLCRYQARCLENPKTDQAVHSEIASSAAQAHDILQSCLLKIVEMEGWDRATLQMPAGMRELQINELTGE